MPTLTVKNVPAQLHRRLKARAARNRRSLNSEIIECLREAAMPVRVDAEALLAQARALRGKVSGRVDEGKLNTLKAQGRP